MTLSRIRNRMTAGAKINLWDVAATNDPAGVTDWAPILEQAIADANPANKDIVVPAMNYPFSRTVVAPNNWNGICIRGETQGSAAVSEWRGVKFSFPGTDGFRVPMVNSKHERLDIQNIFFANSTEGVSGGNPTFNKASAPKAIFVDIDGNRPYNYPQGWWFHKLAFRGFRDAFSLRRIGGVTDPAAFIGTMKWSGIHTKFTDNALYNEACYLNLTNWSDCRFHVGGTFHMEGAGGYYDFIGCHWEAAPKGRFYFSAFSLETEVSMHSCGSELCGTDLGGNNGHVDSFVQFGPGQHTRTYRFYFSGHTIAPGNFEQPWRLDHRVDITNRSSRPIEIEAVGCVIRTPETVHVAPPRPVSAASPAAVSHFWVPLECYNGDGTRRAPQTQAIAGRNADNSGVGLIQSSGWDFLHHSTRQTLEATDANYFGTSIPRSPTTTTPNQVFALSSVMNIQKFNTKPSSPMQITLSGTQTLFFPESCFADDGEMCHVTLIRADATGGQNPVTVDSVYADPVGVPIGGRMSLGYGSFEPVQNVRAPNSIAAVPRWADSIPAINLCHPRGHTIPLALTVPGSGSLTVPIRTSSGNRLAVKAQISSNGGYGEFVFSGIAAAGQKTVQQIVNSNFSLNIGGSTGVDSDIGSIQLTNSETTDRVVRINLNLGELF